MINHIWSILCERVSIDKETNLISYLTCIEEITADKMPAIHQLLVFGSLWQTDQPKKDTLSFRLSLISPLGKEKILVESDPQLIDKERHRTNIILNGIPLEQVGKYIFKLQMKTEEKWKTVSELPLKITVKHTNS